MEIYKIFRAAEWTDLQENGVTNGAPIDLADGYIHLSTFEQVRETVAKHFTQESDLVILGLSADKLSADLKWEVSRGDALFPHLYRALKTTDIEWFAPLPLGDDGHVFPDQVP